MKNWTTKDILNAVLEFKALVPKSDEWNEKSLNHNEPRLIRFKRISSLLKAFELTQTVEQKNGFWTKISGNNKVKEDEVTKNGIISFLNGDFIGKRKSVEYPNIKMMIENEKVFESDIFKPSDVYSFYHRLMKYRMEVDKTLHHNSGIMEISGLGFRAAYKLTSELNNELLNKVEEIDKLLFEIINPKDMSFSQDIMEEEYNFPKDDLDKIDLDNW